MRAQLRLSIPQRVAFQGERRKVELHTFQIQPRVPQITPQIDATNPLRSRRHTHTLAQHRAHRVRSVPAAIFRRSRAVPRVKPIIVHVAIPPAKAPRQLAQRAVHTAVRLPHHDSLSGHPQLFPHLVCPNHGQVPGGLQRRGQVAALSHQWRGQFAQHRGNQHPVHFGPPLQPPARQQPTLHLHSIHQVIRAVFQSSPLQLGTQIALCLVGVCYQRVVNHLPAFHWVDNTRRSAQIGLILENHKILFPKESRLAYQDIHQDKSQPSHAAQEPTGNHQRFLLQPPQHQSQRRQDSHRANRRLDSRCHPGPTRRLAHAREQDRQLFQVHKRQRPGHRQPNQCSHRRPTGRAPILGFSQQGRCHKSQRWDDDCQHNSRPVGPQGQHQSQQDARCRQPFSQEGPITIELALLATHHRRQHPGRRHTKTQPHQQRQRSLSSRAQRSQSRPGQAHPQPKQQPPAQSARSRANPARN